jgi:hypothetical protein
MAMKLELRIAGGALVIGPSILMAGFQDPLEVLLPIFRPQSAAIFAFQRALVKRLL